MPSHAGLPHMSLAFFLVSKGGKVIWAAPEALEWWNASAISPMNGRPFVGLFFFDAPAGGIDPDAEAWALLEVAASGQPMYLQARVQAGGFEARVELSPVSGPTGGAAYAARVERLDYQALAHTQPAVRRMDTPVAGGSSSAPVPNIEPLPSFPPPPGAPSTWDGGPSPWVGLDRAAIGYFDINVDARTALFSDSWKQLLDYDPDEVADEPDTLSTLIHPEDSEAAPQNAPDGEPDSNEPFSAEVRMRAKDDSWRWVELRGTRQFDRVGQLSRVTGIMLNVQERREVEEETARYEDRFNRLTARGRAGFFEIDLHEDTAWYSPELRHALGYRADELGVTPDGFLRLLSAGDAEAGIGAFFQSVTRDQAGLTTRYTLHHKDGRAISFEAYLVMRRNKRGEIEHVTGLQTPASSEAETETQGAATVPDLPTREAPPSFGGVLALAIRQALDSVAEAVFVIDADMLILHANEQACRVTGASPDQLAATKFTEKVRFVDRTSGSPDIEVIQRIFRGNAALELDQTYGLETADGVEEIAITCRPILDERKRTAGAVVVLRRPAEMPLSPAELVKSNRMETLGRLACGIAHDFNNLLTTVVGSLSLAVDRKDLGPLDTAQKACNTAKNLARQLLTYSRGDVAGKKVQSLNEIIKECARMAGAGSKSTVELELAPDLQPVAVVAPQFVQVFTNLIINAMQVMPQGGRIWVRTLNMPLGPVNSVSLPAGDYIRVDVQDNGPGMPPEILSRIFEPFFTTRSEGTGLGLAMVLSIIAQHEGAIEASSTVGSGTTFTMYLPRAMQEAAKETARPLSVSYGTGHVLVMDDDPDLCMIAKGMLEMLGYKADTAKSASEALSMFRKGQESGRKYNVVILDLTMAGGPGGEDVIARLREIDPAVVAIVSSGYATEDNAEQYHKLGFRGVLSKPYRSGDLGRVIKEVLETNS